MTPLPSRTNYPPLSPDAIADALTTLTNWHLTDQNKLTKLDVEFARLVDRLN